MYIRVSLYSFIITGIYTLQPWFFYFCLCSMYWFAKFTTMLGGFMHTARGGAVLWLGGISWSLLSPHPLPCPSHYPTYEGEHLVGPIICDLFALLIFLSLISSLICFLSLWSHLWFFLCLWVYLCFFFAFDFVFEGIFVLCVFDCYFLFISLISSRFFFCKV